MTREAKLIISGDSQRLDRALGEGERRLKGFGRRSIRIMKGVGRTIDRMGERYMTGFNSFLGGAGIVLAGKKVIDFDARLARVAIQAGLTRKQMLGLKDTLFDVGKATHQDPGAMLDYVDAMVERTGDFQGAIRTLEMAGKVGSATGTALEALGATASNLKDKLGINDPELFQVFDIMNVQAKSGAISLSKFAPLMERLAAASGRFNVKGVEGVRVLGAWVQLAKKGSGSAEQATTAIEGAIAEMLDPQKLKMMRKFGFNPIDVDASRKAGRTVMKDLKSVITGVITATKGDESKLGQIFGRESIRSITRIAQVFRETGGFGEFDEFISKGGDGAETMADFAFWSQEAKASIDDFMTGLSEFANKNLTGPIKALKGGLDFLNNHPIITGGGIWALLGLGGAMMAKKLGRGFKGLFGGGAGAPGKGGGLLGGLSGPTPVYVVNKHLSMLPGKGWGFPGEAGGPRAAASGLWRNLMGKRGAALGRLSGMGRVGSTLAGSATGLGKMGTAGLVVGTGLASYSLATALGADKLGKSMGESSIADNTLGKLFDWWYDTNKKDYGKEYNDRVQNHIKVEVKVDKDGRATTRTDDENTRTASRGALL